MTFTESLYHVQSKRRVNMDTLLSGPFIEDCTVRAATSLGAVNIFVRADINRMDDDLVFIVTPLGSSEVEIYTTEDIGD